MLAKKNFGQKNFFVRKDFEEKKYLRHTDPYKHGSITCQIKYIRAEDRKQQCSGFERRAEPGCRNEYLFTLVVDIDLYSQVWNSSDVIFSSRRAKYRMRRGCSAGVYWSYWVSGLVSRCLAGHQSARSARTSPLCNLAEYINVFRYLF